MTIKSIISSLTRDEKLQAMELIWQDLSQTSPDFPSPAWHESVIRERLSDPASGVALGLDEAKSEIEATLSARRTQS